MATPFKIKSNRGITQKKLEKRSGGSGGQFGNRIFVKDGEPMTIQFLDDLDDHFGPENAILEYEKHQFRDDGKWNTVPCIDNCPLDEDERVEVRKVGYAALINVYSHDKKRVYVLEVPKTLAATMKLRRERLGKSATLEQWQSRVFKLERLDEQPKRYDLVPDPDTEAVDPTTLKKHNLDHELQNAVVRYYGDDLAEIKAVEEQAAEDARNDRTPPPFDLDEPVGSTDLDDDADDLDSLDDLVESPPAEDKPVRRSRR